MRNEKDAAVAAVNAAVGELSQERLAREEAERLVGAVQAQLEAIRANAQQRAEAANTAMQTFREEMEAMRILSDRALQSTALKANSVSSVRRTIYSRGLTD